MHGLQEGDLVNIYVGDDLKYESVEVLSVPDKYVFQVAKTEGNISFKWLNVSSDTLTYNIKNENNEDETYIYDVNDGIVRNSENGKIYYVSVADMCNIDDNAQDISFCEVLSNVESHYYVRMFSRVPNFKFSDTEVNDLTVNGNDSDLIERYSNPSDPKCEFENHIGKLGFAQTAYGDEVTEFGQYVLPIVVPQIAKFSIVKAFAPNLKAEFNKNNGEISYDYKALLNIILGDLYQKYILHLLKTMQDIKNGMG